MIDIRSLAGGQKPELLDRKPRQITLPSRCMVLALIATSAFLPVGSTRADTISIKGGGQVQGKVVPDPKDPERIQLWLLNSKKPMSLEKRKILEVVPKPSPLDEYLDRRAKASTKAEAQYELGRWCEQNKLPSLAPSHYEAALADDKSFEPAHQKLGHVQLDGQWVTRDEARAAQGLVKHKGKWVTPEEKSHLDGNLKLSAEQSSWARRIRLMCQALVDGPDDRRREAEVQLMQIKETEAIAPLVRVMGNGDPPLRRLLIQVLGGISGEEAAAALVGRLLIESDAEVRPTALEQLKGRTERTIESRLVRALHSPNIAVVNRAGWAIGQLGMVSAVPKLIPALISAEDRQVWTDPDGEILPGGPNAFAGSMTPGPGYIPGALMADNGSSFAVLTPPVAGPGSVAFGAAAIPYSFFLGGTAALSTANPNAPTVGSTGLAPVAPTLSPNRGPVLRLMTVPIENIEVHDALVALTGQDFEYNTGAWKRWLSREFNPNPAPVRRVPQP